ncbi:MerR family transcriptional regulator [Paenibacillus sp. GCM10027626]|uniref:MerR family transcriptional regulator n=1 Tax=Paenibacillus sp. GCM10027626 TaxID=3273411 RepID=UPI003634D08E
MLYTVKEVSALSNVTIKTLHHYHKIGLLVPCELSEAGYRLYGKNELERLQQILLYKELDFSLEQIQQLMEKQADRAELLAKQESMIKERQKRLAKIAATIRKTILSLEEGVAMEDKELFAGFSTEEEWREALREQNDYLQANYQYELLDAAALDIERMNDAAQEAALFMSAMSEALRAGIKHTDEKIAALLQRHLDFLGENGHRLSASDFAAQTQFFLKDDFHLQMLEGQQVGLAYYLAAAAAAYAH